MAGAIQPREQRVSDAPAQCRRCDDLLEVDSSEIPTQVALADGSIALEGRLLHIPEGQGLGIKPDIAALSDLLVKDNTQSLYRE